jgi:hypothetical protein
MQFLVLSNLRGNSRRLIATALAVLLSVAFVIVTVLMSTTFQGYLANQLTQQMQNADVWVGLNDDANPENSNQILADAAAKIRDLDDVAAVDLNQLAMTELRSGGQRSNAVIYQLPDVQLRWQNLAEGSWPTGGNEIAVDASVAQSLGVSVGDELKLSAELTGKVVGLIDNQQQAFSLGIPAVLATQETLDQLGEQVRAVDILVRGTAVGTEQQLVEQVTAATEGIPDLQVRTRDEQSEHAISELTGSSISLLAILGVFSAVSLLVAGYVIANTFQVLVAQRTKELALLRCVGADNRQVNRLILAEAALVGFVAAVIGCALGAVGSYIFASTLGMADAFTLNPLYLVGVVALGVVMTVICAMSAARTATKVKPIAALQPLETVAEQTISLPKLIGGAVLSIGGIAGLVYAAQSGGIIPAIPAGIIAIVGLLMLGMTFLPQLVELTGRLVARTSTSAELAAANSTKNPLRTAATATSLLIAVAVLVMLVAGIHSVRNSVYAELDQQRPVDLAVVTANPAGFQPAELEAISSTLHVEATAPLHSAQVTVTSPDGTSQQLGAHAVDSTALASVVHDATDVPNPSAGNAMVGPIAENGAQLTIQGEAGTITTVAQVSDDANPEAIQLAQSDLEAISANSITDAVYLKLTPDLSATEIQDVITNLSSLSDEYQVTGGAQERAYYNEILNNMLIAVLALLAVALIISLVGISNTTVLSVLERRKESAMLRAVGLERRQLIATIVMEALLITIVAAVCGCIIGLLFSWSGLYALGITISELPLTFHIPWLQLALIILGAAAAGITAAFLPAVAASKRPPVQDLAMA